jgi:hypothetical protein
MKSITEAALSAYFSSLGKKGGSAKSEAKTKAVRKNASGPRRRDPVRLLKQIQKHLWSEILEAEYPMRPHFQHAYNIVTEKTQEVRNVQI